LFERKLAETEEALAVTALDLHVAVRPDGGRL